MNCDRRKAPAGSETTIPHAAQTETLQRGEILTRSVSEGHAVQQLVNDVHSRLNATSVSEIVRPVRIDEVRETVLRARRGGEGLAVCGGRHAMGGQQFAAGRLLLDMSGMNRPITLDEGRACSRSRLARCGRT